MIKKKNSIGEEVASQQQVAGATTVANDSSQFELKMV